MRGRLLLLRVPRRDRLPTRASSRPGHPYSFDSGGDPEEIPELDYAGFKAFWAQALPSLQLPHLPLRQHRRREAAGLPRPPLPLPLRRPGRGQRDPPPGARARSRSGVEVPYPLAEGSDSATSIIVNWLTVPVTDGTDALAMEVLSELLVGHDGAPLAKALRDSGLGEDLSPQCGVDSSFRQIIFSAGLRGRAAGRGGRPSRRSSSRRVERAAAEGFSPEALDAAMHWNRLREPRDPQGLGRLRPAALQPRGARLAPRREPRGDPLLRGSAWPSSRPGWRPTRAISSPWRSRSSRAIRIGAR